MFSFREVCRFLAVPMAVVMLTVSVPWAAARAALVPTDSVISGMTADQDRQTILNFLSREDVASQFMAFGVNRDEAMARVSAMSNDELRQFANRIDQLPAGQDGFAIAILILVILFVVLVITDLTGVTDVFPFIHSKYKSPQR
jgi:hypothetical protein